MPYDFANLAFVNQFIRAVNDRTQRFNSGTITPAALKSVGDDVQAAAFWGGMQAAVEACVPSYLNSTFAEGTEVTYSDTNGAVPSNGPHAAGNWTLADWRAAAGINAAGFRRMTSTNATAYGTMQAGDVIGDWVFNELAAGLRLLKKSVWATVTAKRRAGFATKFSPSAYSGDTSVDDNPGTLAQAKARRNAAYFSSILTGNLNASSIGGASTDNSNQFLLFFNPDRQYGASAEIAFPVCVATGLPTTASKQIEFWVSTRSIGGFNDADLKAFDPNGFNVLEGCWTILQTVDAGTSSTAAMTDRGHFMPNEAVDANLSPTSQVFYSSMRGFFFHWANGGGSGVVAIVHWTFTDPPV
jgi:hypothetical protein